MNATPKPHSQPISTTEPTSAQLTVGFSGHRRLLDERAVRAAVRVGLAELQASAAKVGVRLMAVSSVALGADLIFAEECLEAGVAWRCLLPFPTGELRKDGYTAAEWARAEACLARAQRVEVVVSETPLDAEERSAAYLECGRRTVEASDVMMLVWNGKSAAGPGGTGDVWDYARKLNKPVWHHNTETGEIVRAG